MSSGPFCLGVPVVDDLKPIAMNCVLRTKNDAEMQSEIRRIQHLLTTKDLIKIYPIGYRPDQPVPTSAYFTEVHISIGDAEEWMNSLGYLSWWWQIATGMKDG